MGAKSGEGADNVALTDTAIRNAKPREKPYKMGDSLGLFLLVQPTGGKLWRLKYRIEGRERKLGLGTYPDVSLVKARKARDEARELIAEGKDPSREKQRQKVHAAESAGHTFAAVAAEYVEKKKKDGKRGWSDATVKRNEHILSLLRPSLGHLPVAEIVPRDVLGALRKVEAKGKLETARRMQQVAGAILRYAVATDRLVSDPTRDLRDVLVSPTVTHYGAITDAKRAGELLRSIDGYEGQGITKAAMQIAPHVFVRPGELRQAQWSELDLDGAVWAIPAEKTKMRKPHHVPLSRQVVAMFRALHDVTGPAGYVFPGIRTRTRPMSENTINAGLRRLGYATDEMTAHGFRAMASTLLNESGKWSPDAIERALAHGDADKVRAAYHRGAHWNERVEMAQWWSDYLDRLREGGEVVPIGGKKAG